VNQLDIELASEAEVPARQHRYGRKLSVGAVVTFVMVLVPAVAAFATSPSPGGAYTGVFSNDGPQAQADIISFLGNLVSTIAPVLIAIALGVIGIIILAWGIRLVFSKVRGAAHF
jgi:hypothetical protein